MKNFIKLHQVIDRAVAQELIIGTSVIIAQHGEVIFEKHAGLADRESKKPVTSNTLFRLASLTKPITSATAFALIEKNLLSLDAPITDWLPDFKPKAPDGKVYDITIRHLLTHTSGLAYGHRLPKNEPYASAGIADGAEDNELSLAENLKRIASVPLLFKPGEQWFYSIGIDVLGAILEKAAKCALPEVIDRYIAKPLMMTDTCFYVREHEHLAMAYYDNPDIGKPACLIRGSQKLPIPENKGVFEIAPGRAFNARAYPSGGAGLSGTAKDYLKFLEMTREGGGSVLNKQSVLQMTTDALPEYYVFIPGVGYGFGLGFGVVRDSKIAGTPRHAGSYEWAGGYGSKAYVDPAFGLTVVILTNTAFYGLAEFQIDITRTLYEDLK